jgi:UDP-N-acetyl-D-mannosaminuronic acid dehydrogenase
MKILNLSKSEIENIAKEGRISLGVLGLGYIGLPTALLFAKANLRVTGRDIDHAKIEKMRNSEVYTYGEKGLEKLLAEVRDRFVPTTEMRDLKDVDVYVLCVPTLIKPDKTLDLSHLSSTCSDVAQYVSKDDLVIVESTVPPGTTEGLIAKILEEGSNLGAGKDFGIAVCPERADPGNILETLVERKRVIGGIDDRSLMAASALFSLIVKHEPLRVPNCRTAEVVKVVENSLRDVDIAYANMIALYCEEMNVDVGTVIDCVNTHPGRRMLRPSAGVGGACVPVNPYFIIQTAKNLNTALLGEARKINDFMATHVLAQVVNWLREEGCDKEARVLMLGYSYKANTGDVRFSPSKEIAAKLMEKNVKVLVYDPLAKEVVSKEDEAIFVDNPYEAADQACCILATVGHEVFKKLNLHSLCEKMRKPLFYDCTFQFDSENLGRIGFKYRGIGRSGAPKRIKA